MYRPANRRAFLVAGGLLIVAIAAADWFSKPYLGLGLLYLFPIMILGGFLSRWQIVAAALLCAVLQEVFSNLPLNESLGRLAFSSAGFVGTGLFIFELIRNRRIVLTHVRELEDQIRLREEAEAQVRMLVESSPAAIVTVDADGHVVLANEAAQQLLEPKGTAIAGRQIGQYIPALHAAVRAPRGRVFRTALQCKGQRGDGETFLAAIWFSTYVATSGPRLAAIIVDLSEDMRSREDLSLDRLLRNTRILMSAAIHEVRNLCSAALVVQKNLFRVAELEKNEDVRALSRLIQRVENLLTPDLQPSPVEPEPVELQSVMDDLRVLVDASYREAGMEIDWQIGPVPPVWADRYGLLQAFLNLAKNSQRAMETSPVRRLRIATHCEADHVCVRFEDTGIGMAPSDGLFQPFHSGAMSSGLGLYVSRAIMRGFGGELVHEPRASGCCFVAMLRADLGR